LSTRAERGREEASKQNEMKLNEEEKEERWIMK
jgi:hypothetical protein